MSKLFKALESKVKRMEQTFRSRGWEKTGTDVKRYVVPDRGRFLQGDNETDSNYSKPDDRDFVIDDAAEQALMFLVSGFMSMLVPETSPWLKLRVKDPALMSVKAVKIWLGEVSQLILDVLSQNDAYSVMQNTFTEFGAFSTGCQLIDEDTINTIAPKSFTYGEYFLVNGKNNKPNSFAAKSFWNAEELRAEFGEGNLSPAAQRDLKDGSTGTGEKRYLVWFLIEPNDGRTKGLKNPQGLPFNAVYWQQAPKTAQGGEQKLLRISGYHEFPVQAPRWSTISNDTYGKEAPGVKQLNATKMLQSIVEDRLVATNLMGRPPLVSNGHDDDINNLPGGITYGVDVVGNAFSVQPLMPNYRPDINAMLTSEGKTVSGIEIGFYKPLFLITSDVSDAKRMTATEVVSRNEEKFAMLGPILNRVFNELLKPMIDRVFNILTRQGFFDEDGVYPIPEELLDIELEVEFTSILAQAQKAVGLNNIDRFIERVTLLMGVDESVKDKVDLDAVVEEWGLNVPAKLIRDPEETAAIREFMAEQNAAAQQQAMMESNASIAKDMGSASTAEGTALGDLAEEES